MSNWSGNDHGWRQSGEDWPTQWDGGADKWPRINHERWVPGHSGAAVVICQRSRNFSPMLMTTFKTVNDALTAEDRRHSQPCSEGCAGRHAIVWTEPGRLHVIGSPHDKPVVPASLPLALLAAGYTRPNSAPPARYWPTIPPTHRRNGHPLKERPVSPAKPQQPTPEPEEPVTEPDNDEAMQIIRCERAAGQHLARLGLNRRAALAWREVADLRASCADRETVELAEKAAQVLTDLAVADLGLNEAG